VRKVWAVLRREFRERLRSPWFWISAMLAPVFFAAIVVLPVLLAGGGGTKRIAVVDATTDGFGARVADSLGRNRAFAVVARLAPSGGLVDSLTRAVGARQLDGFLLVGDETQERGAAEYRAANISSFRDIGELRGVLGRLAVNARLEHAGVDPGTVSRAQVRITLDTKKISGTKTTGESTSQSFSLAYVMAIVLFMVIAIYGVNVMSSVLEEKTTRIVEVLVSSIRPFQLMAGKVLGVGAVSIFQFVIWGVGGRLLVLIAGRLAFSQRARFAGSLSEGGSGVEMFALPHVSAATLAVFLGYFLGGFFLYSAMYAAVGAMSSSEQEARQAQQPVMFLLLIAYVSVIGLASDPTSSYAVALSLIPFSSPIAMPVRWATGSLGPGDLVASLVLLGVAIVVVTWIAARIYRVGILMTGKRPSLKELARWVRAG
jgi:ABC-2 type transport system permease protein